MPATLGAGILSSSLPGRKSFLLFKSNKMIK
jgi:hypothetical protein